MQAATLIFAAEPKLFFALSWMIAELGHIKRQWLVIAVKEALQNNPVSCRLPARPTKYWQNN